MASLMRILNRLLPFATPGTPVIQDLVHLAAVCLLLYYAPQIQESWQRRRTEGVRNEDVAEPQNENQDQDAQVDPIDMNDDGRNQERDAVEQEADVQEAVGENDEFRAFQQQQQAQDAPIAGPANAANGANERNVGAKKAKSLARKDQKRAYHEFQRAQGEAQRARDAEGASGREAAQAAERERRKAAEAKLEAKKAKEREERKEQERREREEGIARRELAVRTVKGDLDARQKSNLFEVAQQLGGDADEIWLEKLLNASGMLGTSSADGSLTFITSTGWVVRVTRENMMRVYESAVKGNAGDENGRIEYEEIARLLEKELEQ